MTKEMQTIGDTPEKRRLGKRIEEVAWALFLVMTGTLWLAPSGWIPEGTWLAGAGLILLGLNAARHFYGLGLQGFGIVAGIAALIGGVGRILGRNFLFIPILLIAWGAAMIIKSIAGPAKSDQAAG
jgi:hypothetical protein